MVHEPDGQAVGIFKMSMCGYSQLVTLLFFTDQLNLSSYSELNTLS